MTEQMGKPSEAEVRARAAQELCKPQAASRKQRAASITTTGRGDSPGELPLPIGVKTSKGKGADMDTSKSEYTQSMIVDEAITELEQRRESEDGFTLILHGREQTKVVACSGAQDRARGVVALVDDLAKTSLAATLSLLRGLLEEHA